MIVTALCASSTTSWDSNSRRTTNGFGKEPGYRPLSVPRYDDGRAKELKNLIEDAMNRALVPVMVAALLGAAVSVAHGQQAFKTPDEAASGLAAAAKADDMKALVT